MSKLNIEHTRMTYEYLMTRELSQTPTDVRTLSDKMSEVGCRKMKPEITQSPRGNTWK